MKTPSGCGQLGSVTLLYNDFRRKDNMMHTNSASVVPLRLCRFSLSARSMCD